MLPPSVLCTEFDLQAKHLCLAPEEYVASARLRKWCEQNKNQYYIPEWLLKAWNMSCTARPQRRRIILLITNASCPVLRPGWESKIGLVGLNLPRKPHVSVQQACNYPT